VQTKIYNESLKFDKKADEKKESRILLLNQNSIDCYMIEKFLPKEEGFHIFRASTLIEALKILNYVKIDLVIVDDQFDSNIDDILKKLSLLDKKEHCPVMILLSSKYEKSLVNRFSKNIDFIKKPIDEELLKYRVKLSIDNEKDSLLKESYFAKLAQKRLNQFQDTISIYYDIFKLHEQMMLIFDPKEAIFLEANLAFEKNFTNVAFLNRILKKERVYREFIPYIDEANYINHYDIDSFLNIIEQNLDFNYALRIKNGFNEYSFSTIFKEIYINSDRYYLIKLVDLYDYIKEDKNSSKDELKQSNLNSFKDEFIRLKELLAKEGLKDNKIQDLIYKISSKLSIVCEDDKILKEVKVHDLQDIYNILLKSGLRYKDKKITINSKEIKDIDSSKLNSDFLTKIDEDLFIEFLSKIFENSADDIDILIYNTHDMIIIEYSYSSEDLFIKKENLKDYIKSLDITLEIVNENDRIIVIINIPKNI